MRAAAAEHAVALPAWQAVTYAPVARASSLAPPLPVAYRNAARSQAAVDSWHARSASPVSRAGSASSRAARIAPAAWQPSALS